MLLPAKVQLAHATVGKYRELLRKLNANSAAGDESAAAAFQQAKQRVVSRLLERSERARVDPLGALHRLQARLAEARHRRRLRREGQAQPLRQRLQRFYLEAVSSRSTGAVGERMREPRSISNEEAGAAALSAATHSNALFRVRSLPSAAALWLMMCTALPGEAYTLNPPAQR